MDEQEEAGERDMMAVREESEEAERKTKQTMKLIATL